LKIKELCLKEDFDQRWKHH